MTEIAFVLSPPVITVKVLAKEDLPELRDVIRLRPEFFPQLKDDECQKVKIYDNTLIIPGDNSFDNKVIVRPGFYLLTSDNGKRFFTDDPKVRHGIFLDVSWELLVPGYGSPATNNQ